MQNITYFIYARKSDESEDRQITSIEDQIAETKRIANEMNLSIVDIISEAKSAKNPGRPAFKDMMKRIQKGEANGILCWKLNRLARNPVDGGLVSMLLQQGVIQHVQTQGQSYLPSDNVLMMLLEFGMANQFVKDLSVDVKRGMLKKAERGWMPSRRLPVGYKHNPDRIQNNALEIIKDKKMFLVVSHLWKLLLTGEYAVSDLKKVGDDMGLIGYKDKKLSMSSYYRVFRNPFYYGYFNWKDSDGSQTSYKGKHIPMITFQEFNKAQSILGRKNLTPQKYTKKHLYLSLFQCGECGCSFTREVTNRAYCYSCKSKFSIKNKDQCDTCNIPISQKKNFSFMKKVYYRCTKKRSSCSQSYVNEKEVTKQIINHINKIKVNESFYQWGLLALHHIQLQDPNEKLRAELQSKLQGLQSKIKRYTEMRADNEITASEYNEYKLELQEQITALESKLTSLDDDKVNWKEIFEETLNFVSEVKNSFLKQGHTTKQRIVRELGLNPSIMDKKLYFSSSKLLLLWQKCQRVYTKEKRRLEPKKAIEKLSLFDSTNLPFSILCAELEKARIDYIIR